MKYSQPRALENTLSRLARICCVASGPSPLTSVVPKTEHHDTGP